MINRNLDGAIISVRMEENPLNKAISTFFLLLFFLFIPAKALGGEIHEAAKKGYTDRVREIIIKKPALVNKKDENGFTPAMWAAMKGHGEILELLRKSGADVNIFHYAVTGDTRNVEKILNRNTKLSNKRNKDGYTPLHLAAAFGKTNMVKLLINRGANIKAKTKEGITPLYSAASSGKVKILDLLIKKGADPNSRNKHGKTPLFAAVESGNGRVVAFLIKNGVNINLKDKYGNTPYTIARKYGNDEIISLLSGGGENIDINMAAMEGDFELVKKILSKNPGTINNVEKETGFTPLHQAMTYGWEEMAEYLILKGADPNIQDKYGDTALHLAGSAKEVKLLLKKGARINLKNKKGLTPLESAVKQKNKEKVEILRKWKENQ